MHALYIHWPFCKSKCPYCDFNSHVREKVDQQAWREGLLAELRWYAKQSIKTPLTSIFFGGGTPSLMPPETAHALIQEAEQLFGFTPDIEITLEANPTSVERENFKALAKAGVNRLSLGVQSFRAEHLAFLGREHSAEDAEEAIHIAADHFARYSFDLIYALPQQRLEDWQEELEEALPKTRGHLSVYQLTIEPGTNFYHQHRAGKFTMPEGDALAAFYHTTNQRLEAAKMPAYEISNHAAAGQAPRHNLAYWRSQPYLGIGPGAHGRMATPDGTRHATLNLRNPEKWLAQTQQQCHGQELQQPLTQQERIEEAILMGLRLRDGLQADYLPIQAEDFLSLWPASLLEGLRAEGLLTITPTAITPTAEGRLLLDSLTGKLAMHAKPIKASA